MEESLGEKLIDNDQIALDMEADLEIEGVEGIRTQGVEFVHPMLPKRSKAVSLA